MRLSRACPGGKPSLCASACSNSLARPQLLRTSTVPRRLRLSGPRASLHDAASAIIRRAQHAAAGAAAAAVLLAAPPLAGAATTIRFPLPPSPEIFAVQKTLIQAWSIVTEAFVDPHFNAVAWDAELASALAAASAAPSPEAAAETLPSLLGKLGDRFTRWVPAREYADFRVASDGELQGVGLLIASDPVSGHLVVLAPIAGSPADRAGIRPGDEVERVDGAPTDGWDDARAARSLRGAGGSAVSVGIARRLDNGGAGSPGPRDIVPGVPAAPAGSAAAAAMEHRTLRLRRERLELSPVYAAAMHGEDDRTYGYIRLAAFSQHAAADMLRALGTLGRDGVDGYILDLRNNPGGLVNAAMDVAGLWLDPRAHPVVLRIQDRGTGGDLVGRARGGAAAAEIASAPQVSEKAVVLDGDRGPAVSAPLVVLVNRQSASASEILASALQDNGRATVIGEPTFGKGKIQSVYELGDGSALFVTVAKYKTASGLEIDGMGVMPSQTCRPIGSSQPTSSGIPIGPGADARVMEEVEQDSCVLTAEQLLHSATRDLSLQARATAQA
ncbi:CTPB1 [Auxenochlorella protothecoides x Auxenochlorella symbiontica]